MSKKDLKNYLQELSKEQLEEQLLDLYSRFKEVKTFYNFVFQPKEGQLLEEAKFKITKEYFPLNGRKPKARRSVGQKLIRHFMQLGVEPAIIADVMLYNIEVSQQYSREKLIKQEAFFKSILKSFQEATKYIQEHQLAADFENRMNLIVEESRKQHWMNVWGFEDALYMLTEV